MDIKEIAGYRVIRQLGGGGMGQVFLVMHPRLPRQDALKLLDSGVSRNDDFKARFQREADLLAKLSHSNIVTLYDRGQFEGRLWITMEYINGTDAAELLKTNGPFDPDLAIPLISGAGAALDYAWRKQRITHRDVKPANILLGIDEAHGVPQIESVKLADFGIAKAAGESTSLTSTGMTIGTMQYISPEAIEGEEVDNRSDIYSLGCTAFHVLTGQPPFAGSSIAAVMSAHLTKPVPSVNSLNSDLPETMDAVFERALAKIPADRYQSCAEFVSALQEAAGGKSHYPAFARTLTAPRPTRDGVDPNAPTKLRKAEAKAAPQSKPRMFPFVAAAAAVLVVAASLGTYLLRPGDPDTDTTSISSSPRPTIRLPAPPETPPAVATSVPPAPTTPTVTPTVPTVTVTSQPTTAASPSIYAGMPCDSPGAESPDGRFGCSGLNRIWVDRNAPPLPTIGWDSIGAPCTSPGAKARLEASDGVLTCTATGGSAYTWVSGPY